MMSTRTHAAATEDSRFARVLVSALPLYEMGERRVQRA
jgi:hypothetical protein